MTQLDQRDDQHDIETPDTIQVRFGIEVLDANPADAIAVMSMPMSGLRNPFTDAPTVGPLAILVDAAGGMVNHYRRRADQWTVSSELSVELSPDSIENLDSPVVASARARWRRRQCTVDLHAALQGHRDRRCHGAVLLCPRDRGRRRAVSGKPGAHGADHTRRSDGGANQSHP
jgi:hypothetical protein